MRLNKAKYEEFKGIYASKGLEYLEDRARKLNGIVNKALDQAGSDLDMAKITHPEFAGSDLDKVSTLTNMHAEQSAIADTIQEKRDLAEWRRQILDKTGVSASDLGTESRTNLDTQNGQFQFGDVGDRTLMQSFAAFRKDTDEFVKNLREKGSKAFLNREFKYAESGIEEIYAATLQRGNPLEPDLQGGRAGTLFSGGGLSPEVSRSGRIVWDMLRPIQITPMLPSINTTDAAYKYLEEVFVGTDTAAAPGVPGEAQKTGLAPGDTAVNREALALSRPELGALKEAKLQFRDRITIIESVGIWMPMSEEQLADVPSLRMYVRRRLPFMVLQDCDGMVMNGTGRNNQVLGLRNVTGVQTRAQSAKETAIDTTRRAITDVMVNGQAMPGPFLLHPMDWTEIQLTKTKEGTYLYGSPAGNFVNRLWGHPVVEQWVIPQGEGVIGDFANYSLLLNRQGMTVDLTDSHKDLFAKLVYAIRCRVRMGIAWLRPQAFCRITGLQF